MFGISGYLVVILKIKLISMRVELKELKKNRDEV